MTIDAAAYVPATITLGPGSASKLPRTERNLDSSESATRGAPPMRGPLVRLTIARAFSGRAWVSGGELRVPMRVHLEARAGGRVTAFEPTLNIFGDGHDVAAAVEDFRAALVEHRDVLASSARLSADLEEQLAILRRYLRAA